MGVCVCVGVGVCVCVGGWVGDYHGQTAFRRPLVADPGSTHTISFVRRSPDPDGVELPLDSQSTGSAIFLR